MSGGGEGVREKSLLEELETLPVEDHIKQRLIKKYWADVDRNRDKIKNERQNSYKREKVQVEKIQEQEIIISVLTNFIKGKELL